MTTAEILAKLEPTLAHEGVVVEVLRESEENLHIRAKRIAPGVPVAFLVKAIAGTLRRYHENLREVVLEEYDPGENIPVPEEVSPEFDKVLKHRPSAVSTPQSQEWMGLDLRGSDRAHAVRALETAHRIWSAQSLDRFLVRGLDEDPVERAWLKWSTFYDHVKSSHPGPGPGELVIHLENVCSDQACLEGRSILWMPGRILVSDLTP